VASVDYRLAPEFKYPVAGGGFLRALKWVVANGHALGLDSARIAVGGDSAGGNLAAVMALLARDRRGPRLLLQILVYPVTNYDLAPRRTARTAPASC
jgi:acetyl esterase